MCGAYPGALATGLVLPALIGRAFDYKLYHCGPIPDLNDALSAHSRGSVLTAGEVGLITGEEFIHFVGVYGLDKVRVDSCFIGTNPVCLIPIPGDGRNQGPFRCTQLPQGFRNLPPVHLGQRNVQQHNVRGILDCHLQRHEAVRCHENLMSVRATKHGQAIRRVALALNDEDSQNALSGMPGFHRPYSVVKRWLNTRRGITTRGSGLAANRCATQVDDPSRTKKCSAVEKRLYFSTDFWDSG
jgi:hypothetical protein